MSVALLALSFAGCGKPFLDRSSSKSLIESYTVPENAPARPPQGSGVIGSGPAASNIFRFDYFPGRPAGVTMADRKRLEWWVDENFASPVVIQVCHGNSVGTCRDWLRVRCSAAGCAVDALQGELPSLTPGEHFTLSSTRFVPIRMSRFVLSEWAFEVLPDETSLRIIESGTATWVWGNLLAN